MIGEDRYFIISPQCLPSASSCMGDISGSAEPSLDTRMVPIENNSSPAQHIMREGHRNGVNWAVSKPLTLDLSTCIRYHYGVQPVKRLKMIPIYLSMGVEPLIDNRRCSRIGQSIGHGGNCGGNEHVAAFDANGGVQRPDNANMQRLYPVYDRSLLGLLEAGDIDTLTGVSDERILVEVVMMSRE